MYVVQEPAFLYRDHVRNIPTYLPTYCLFMMTCRRARIPRLVAAFIPLHSLVGLCVAEDRGYNGMI